MTHIPPGAARMVRESPSHYRIGGVLGAGGMRDVDRARDTRLGRDVGIKVLPALVASDAERLARFRRVLLNQPHIATVHGLEQTDGKPWRWT